MVAHFDVLVVGAGLSGIGAACRLQQQSPDRTYAVLEARDTIGGTWDLFRYPGVRSDSDMFTLGYPFRPWRKEQAIASGAEILEYIRDTAAEHEISRHIRFGHRVVRASWSSSSARWTVEASHDGEAVTHTCSFLYLCSGYYSYENGHVVDFPGRASFRGEIVHPQFWPEESDFTGKRVVVIGSGATAVTLVPELASTAKSVTMLQRSPSYVLARPWTDSLARRLRRFLPSRLAYHAVRAKNVLVTTLLYQFSRRQPQRAAAFLREAAAKQLPASIPVDPHFSPRYRPWDQRLCLTPGADFFRALRSGRADIVTDRIDRFTPDGITLESGAQLPADVVVTATGLRVIAFGGIELSVDGKPIEPAEQLVYKGMMLGGVPNLAWCIGYVNASWTLRSDLVSRYVCRLLNHLSRNGFDICVARPPAIPSARRRPVMDLTSGYLTRAASVLPRQGDRRPWLMRQNYLLDAADLRLSRVDDGVLRFERAESQRLTS
ncbi:flavin-containing monooxygenase [Amycolatopsis dendrobii]|uniref:NAD(P)/FAD-dependent oxidoreductase n=1 Tax=Amycolatopsis dendrobii TaxID=2760662 RepID=A0A7W3W6S3_9PSEU|nr:NAD(P)/FAD-dependent oxidoreductase [Amycolatopsis dendrobii]MBB1159302.1 NAD(P)/FAD-dependent oxidoreductase [Amycolatopsis dendrobii]